MNQPIIIETYQIPEEIRDHLQALQNVMQSRGIHLSCHQLGCNLSIFLFKREPGMLPHRSDEIFVQALDDRSSIDRAIKRLHDLRTWDAPSKPHTK